MALISVDTESIIQATTILFKKLPDVHSAKLDIIRLQSSLSSDVKGRRGIDGKISSILSKISSLDGRVSNIPSTAQYAMSTYRDAEREIYNKGIKNIGFPNKNINESYFQDQVVEFIKDLLDFKDIMKKIDEHLARTFLLSVKAESNKLTTSLLSYKNNSTFYGLLNTYLDEGNNYGAGVSLFQLINNSMSLNALGLDYSQSRHKVEVTGYGVKLENNEDDSLYLLKANLGVEDSITSEYNLKKINDTIEKNLKKKGYIKEDDNEYKGEYDPITGKWKASDGGLTNAKRLGTLAEYGVGVSGTVSLLEGTLSGKTDWGNGSISAKIGNAEAEASLSAGLYYVNKNGDKTFSPGVSAKVGGSVSALEINANGQIGTDMLGFYGKGQVSALTAESKASVGLGMVNGKLEMNAAASAEAILAEASAAGGLNILGGEVGGRAAVNFGIGAKADIGYADGKIKCELGASLGVGIDLSIEADVGGMVDTVGDAVGDAVDVVGDVVNDVGGKIYDAGKFVFSLFG